MPDAKELRSSFQRSATDKDAIEYIIESPLRCGFLLAFCRSQYNVENLSFLIAVMRFKDMLAIDKSVWSKGWREIDAEVKDRVLNFDDGSPEKAWPSSKINRKAVVESMQQIVDDFISRSAPNEICISRQIADNTLERVQMIDLYGPEVFTEATYDPLKTIRKDILPRFRVSHLYNEMIMRINSINPLPTASELKVPPPEKRIIDEETNIKNFFPERQFELYEFMECEILYSELLMFLQKSVSSENLLCLRMISIFEDKFLDGDTQGAEDDAWTIYRFFIAAGAAYEISLKYVHRKILMQSMALPTVDMFEEVKRSSHSSLKRDFESFKDTPKYIGLSTMLHDMMAAKARGLSLGKMSCLG
mmetsp:Transcript_27848/g.28100  ORF Transcript_27848/g.28100 Transcript_27848/m.28100 type:complete len:361 (+) Transcript_27848:54-1136(+)